ncbi:MAG: siphovirus Gp157 family protein [Candidatus Peribacteraceae bacterium]|nr:siphovirus Gp157 family protein [Candidatus Peribacteraceae bacterium]
MEDNKLQTIQEETSEVLLRSNSLTIENAETLSNGIDLLTRVKAFGKKSKEIKKELLEPFEVALKNAKDKFKPAEKACKDAEVIVKDKIKIYTGELPEGEDFCAEGKEGKISIRRLTKLIIEDETKIPEEYLTKVPNKKLIEATLLSGKEVPGAKIEIDRTVASLKL